ncbi:Ras-related protein Rab-13 [Trichoplax sp. H2]|uniref:Uncharacterized protein n=1 Tax=Trichoplax adhaerens TaxID=10228 RepID=B3RU33_TRIAD|nr:hypothetical protein TRIADDRAFT_55139 [Trichoplax adhaerens]EDV25273.1 hypothetical protein TRIADDRAFT_55139 [Trichoplax adhaerens]RDD37212.1 Ras-related protein Rab-13 [Trichoplax sp. H2]|eukprot:XP_002111306.1 hypothetical protein TRIADDRAFT_55139 [Trichoplax adhaerens]
MPQPLETFDHNYKVLIVGDSGVGKTCVLLRFKDNDFQSTLLSTIGIDLVNKQVVVDDKKIMLQIWDTAGQERYKTLTKAFYRGTSGILLVYDITKKKSFDNIRYWMKCIADCYDGDLENAPILFIVGNKNDLPRERKIKYDDGQLLAIKYSVKFFETSAYTNCNVNDVFYRLAEDMYYNSTGKRHVTGPVFNGTIKVDRKKSTQRKESDGGHSCC